MDRQTKRSLFLIIGILALLFCYTKFSNKCPCKERISYDRIDVNKEIDLGNLFKPADSLELAAIKASWQDFSTASDSFSIIKEMYYAIDRKLLIIEQYAKGRKHYGAIILPYQYDKKQKYPLLLWANGLNQQDPTSYMEDDFRKKLYADLSNYFILIPAYRGQALSAYGKRYCADGFFGDAFDGATDDAFRLLYLTQTEFKGVDKQRVAVWGVSRGGTVALLMGARDTTINTIISQSGSVDFFAKAVYQRYNLQYKYQFLSKRVPISKIRAKMLKSSPIYFIDNYPNGLMIAHGKNDQLVPIANANRLMEKMKINEQLVTLIDESGHQFNQMNQLADWLKVVN